MNAEAWGRSYAAVGELSSGVSAIDAFEGGLAGRFRSTLDGVIVDCNLALRRLLELGSTDMPTCNWLGLCVNPSQREAILTALHQKGRVDGACLTLATGRHQHVLHAILSVVHVVDTATNVVYLHGEIVDDTTRQDALDQLRRAERLALLGATIGALVHDFNNQLTTIRGFADLIAARVETDPGLTADIDQLRAATDRAAALSRRMLRGPRRSGEGVVAVDVNDVLVELTPLLERVLGPGIGLAVNLDPALPRGLADPQQLSDVLLNLTLNARDAMNGCGKLTIETAYVGPDRRQDAALQADPDARTVCVRVTDTGPGISPSVTQNLFRPFCTTKGEAGGSGFGLFSIAQTIRALQGDLRVDSSPGKGTAFEIRLRQTTLQSTGAAVRPSRLGFVGGGETVLVVDGDVGVRRTASRVLTHGGYRVVEAATGCAALATMADGLRPDVLVVDRGLPDMDELAGRARGRVRRPVPPTLFTSARPASTHGPAGTSASNVLTKPFTGQALLAGVQRLLAERNRGGKRARTERRQRQERNLHVSDWS